MRMTVMDNSFDNLKKLAVKFDIQESVLDIAPIGNGVINDTYIVKTKIPSISYILQKKNKDVFKNIPEMMDNIVAVTEHITNKTRENPVNTLRIIKSCGKPYILDESGEYWTMTNYIPDTVTFEKATELSLARKAGEGIGRFQAILEDFKGELFPTIPGFHDIEFRFKQWDESLRKDRAGKKDYLTEEIAKIESRRKEMMEFRQLFKTGELPKRVTHNDTKISNILFDLTGEVVCVIDLDTVMSSTWLNDFGDAIRTFAATASEDEADLSKVELDIEMFRAYAEGYVTAMNNALSDKERKYLYFGALYIIFEQALRFLMDYIDGDIYYKTLYPEHNLVRARNQLKLLESAEKKKKEMIKIINDIN